MMRFERKKPIFHAIRTLMNVNDVHSDLQNDPCHLYSQKEFTDKMFDVCLFVMVGEYSRYKALIP